MNNFFRTFGRLFKKEGSRNSMSILLLSIGLAMGLVLIAKIYFERTYESFVPNIDRTYRIISQYGSVGGEAHPYDHTAGAIAPGIKSYSPAVEAATRCTELNINAVIKIVGDASRFDDKSGYLARETYLVDSSFFDIFKRQIYVGNAKEIMETAGKVMVSRSFAQKLVGNGRSYNEAIGLSIIQEAYPDEISTIEGIYEDFPLNSIYSKADVLYSLPSIGRFMGDGRDNWAGNDRYDSYLRLNSGAKPDDVRNGIIEMCKEHLPAEELEAAGVTIDFNLMPLSEYHSTDSSVKKMCTMLIILAIAVLVVAVLNYVLIAISAMVQKAKMVAIHKCYGASRFNIYEMIFSETFVNLLISLVVSAFVVFSCQNVVEKLIGTSLSSLLTGNVLFVLLAVCLLVFVICGFLPGMVYSRIPVATAFRRFKENSRTWKLFLLFVQFAASTFFITLLLVVILQYKFMLSSDTGYAYKNLVYMELPGASPDKKDALRQELERLSFVEGQTLTTMLPFDGGSGNNIRLPNDDRDYFNIADMYSVEDDYFELLEIPIIEGRNFNQENPAGDEVMVSRSFIKKAEETIGWTDGVVGKEIYITEHGKEDGPSLYTICGVYEDYLLGYIGGVDSRASVQFYSKTEPEWFKDYLNNLIVKINKVTPENMKTIRDVAEQIFPDREIQVKSYSTEMISLYAESRRFRDAVMISGLVVLLITIIGLIGYSHDEINRRRSEIAIRKINGATLPELLRLFLNSILKIDIVAVIIGLTVSYYVSSVWLEQFSRKIDLSWWIFAGCALIAMAIVAIVVLLTTHKAANANPVENLSVE